MLDRGREMTELGPHQQSGALALASMHPVMPHTPSGGLGKVREGKTKKNVENWGPRGEQYTISPPRPGNLGPYLGFWIAWGGASAVSCSSSSSSSASSQGQRATHGGGREKAY